MTVLKVANHKSRVKNAGGKKLINKRKKHHFPSNNPVSRYAKRKEGGGTDREIIWEFLEDRMGKILLSGQDGLLTRIATWI